MRKNIKAALLSAFILPGLGQLYKGERIKGGIMIFLVNIFLLAAFALVLKEGGQLFLTSRLAGTTAEAAKVLDRLQQSNPAVRWLLLTFFVLWAYALADSLFGKGGDHDGAADEGKSKG